MRIEYNKRALDDLEKASLTIKKAFFKQLRFLAENLNHPSLHAKKYDEGQDLWQARVTRGWRFYFTIEGGTYRIQAIIQHPK